MNKKKKNNLSINISAKELKAICKQYEYNDEQYMFMTDEENETVYKIKKILSTLPIPDFIIFCLYMEYQSERKVARILGCSRTPIHKLLMEIKQKILCSI